jgi:hypothetical protein
VFRPNPAIIRILSERVSVFIRSVRMCNDGEISSSVGLIIAIIETVAWGGVVAHTPTVGSNQTKQRITIRNIG